MKHPAKFTDAFFDIFYDMLRGSKNVLDPFAGTGKIGKLKEFGFDGTIYANEIEEEWLSPNEYHCDVLSYCDAEFMDYPDGFFDAICTSPTYGNRMADHHNAKDGSKRITYTHCLGRQLTEGNTGNMHWGVEYIRKHRQIYSNLARMIKPGGKFVLNVKNHIRRGKEVDVTSFHIAELRKNGFYVAEIRLVKTPGLKYGANASKRMDEECIVLLIKGCL